MEGFEKSSQTEQHEVQNQNDATKAHLKGKSESHPLKHHKDPAAFSLADMVVVGGGCQGVLRPMTAAGFRRQTVASLKCISKLSITWQILGIESNSICNRYRASFH